MKKNTFVFIFVAMSITNIVLAGGFIYAAIQMEANWLSAYTAVPALFGIVSGILSVRLWKENMPKVMFMRLTYPFGLIGTVLLTITFFSHTEDDNMYKAMFLLSTALVAGICSIFSNENIQNSD